MNLRKLIREEIEKVLNNSEELRLYQDIHYLNGFNLLKTQKTNHIKLWVFEHRTKNYSIRFFIEKDNFKKTWKAKIFIYWKAESSEYTNARGKDCDCSFGPYQDYKDMISELNLKLKNNPIFSLSNFKDDNKLQFDNDAMNILPDIQKKQNIIALVKDSYFNDLKKISNEIKNMTSEEELKKYASSKADDFTDKQTFLLTLQKIHQLDNFLTKEKLESLF